MSDPATSPRFRCVVAATDFSPASERAIAWACRWASHRDAELLLVHAVEWREPSEVLVAVGDDATQELSTAAGVRLAELAAQLRTQVRAVSWSVEAGPAAKVILQAATAHGAELVVIGTRGLRGWQHVLMGSTAQRILARSSCPVLAVHRTDPPPPERAWRLVAATDGSPESLAAIRTGMELAGPGPERVVLLRVFEPPLISYPGASEAMPDGLIEDMRHTVEGQLQAQATELIRSDIKVVPALRDGFPPEAIAGEAAKRRADLVLIGNRGRGLAHLLVGSTAERVVQRANVPVLVVPVDAGQEPAAPAMAIAGAPIDEQC